MNASQVRYGPDDLAELFAGARRVIVAKGKKVATFDLGPRGPLTPEIAQVVLGPTGNLRAPTARVGSTWFVGFLAEAWDDAFG